MSRDALVVGINAYDGLNRLTAPAHDAEAIAQLLTHHGDFQVRRLPEVVQDNRLQVGQKTQVTLEELEEAIVQLFLPSGRSIPDTALFYFSGHGLRKERGIPEGFLAASDANSKSGNWGIRLKWLREVLQESPIRQQIVWLDCCFSGELFNIDEANPGEKGKGRDRCFIAAAREFEIAYEGINDAHSVLTKAILEGLDPARGGDRWITNHSLSAFLSQQFESATQRPVFANFGEPIGLTRAAMPRQEVTHQVPTVAICPYKGLEYFDCNDQDPKYFYGRETLTDQLLDQVRQGSFLAIAGASGSGKSSVLRAGLIHQLKQGRRLSGSDRWQILILKPGEHPLQSLAKTFLDPNLSTVERAKQLEFAEQQLAQGAEGLRRLIQSSPHPKTLLVIDQFEEVFTLCQNLSERQQFFACLLGALELTQPSANNGDVNHPPDAAKTQNSKLSIVLAMRADFFGKCLEQDYGGLAQQIQQNLVTVTPMSREELQNAILKPAKQVSLNLEPELVSQMLTDVEGSPGSLPLLQYTLTELWKQRTDNCLQLKTYTQLGGVVGTLQKRATEVYNSFSPEQQAAAQHIFLSLTQLGEGTEDTRRRVLKQDLISDRFPEALIDVVVQRLADEKLIVTDEQNEKGGSNREAVIDVAHEALIRHWLLLRKWLNENRDQLRQKRKIEERAEEWRLHHKSKDYLLQGKPLADAKAFHKQQANTLSLSGLAVEFIQKSSRQKRVNQLRATSLLTFPTLVVFVAIVPHLRQANYDRAWSIIETRGAGTREALEVLTEGCREKQLLRWVPEYLSTLIWGNCAGLIGANLRNTDLRLADLRFVDLSNADLSGANLSGAGLIGANLRNTDLSGANLRDANLIGADLRDADLLVAELFDADLRLADLSNANLSFADLSSAELFSANLSGADLSNANLRFADLLSADLFDTDLSSALYTPETRFPQSFDPSDQGMYLIAPNADLLGANLTGADLIGANLSGADLIDANLIGADLSGANLIGADLSGANLTGADLIGANLRDANFTGADLLGANLFSANLRGADLRGADLIDADLRDANLRGATNLTPEQVKAARNWEEAIYDEEFRRQLGLEEE
jgi:uncharacterized protein YjbI with pentapeptide repeats/energy-coupling factor transporter ATP-binding protein EcfA2